MKIDYSRMELKIQEIQAELDKVRAFQSSRTVTLLNQRQSLEAFARRFNAEITTINNMYSTGMTGTEYEKDARMLATVHMIIKKPYKNLKLVSNKMNEAFKEMLEGITNEKIYPYKFHEDRLDFQIWIS